MGSVAEGGQGDARTGFEFRSDFVDEQSSQAILDYLAAPRSRPRKTPRGIGVGTPGAEREERGVGCRILTGLFLCLSSVSSLVLYLSRDKPGRRATTGRKDSGLKRTAVYRHDPDGRTRSTTKQNKGPQLRQRRFSCLSPHPPHTLAHWLRRRMTPDLACRGVRPQASPPRSVSPRYGAQAATKLCMCHPPSTGATRAHPCATADLQARMCSSVVDETRGGS